MKRENWIIAGLVSLLLLVIGMGLVQNWKNGFSFEPTSSIRMPAKNGVAVLYVYGPIAANPPSEFLSMNGVDSIIQQLETIERNKRVKALVLRINSPGGTVGASQELYEAIKAYKMRKKVPVVVSIADVGASGGYWVSLAGDYIFANRGSLVGSIG
ncbi:MAG: S49 family peptidase, partial [Candidatus Margulisbacteria bacterium]|nr:S49 family peptidase [Candidatus Margulisiibacteriota bacterium]